MRITHMQKRLQRNELFAHVRYSLFSFATSILLLHTYYVLHLACMYIELVPFKNLLRPLQSHIVLLLPLQWRHSNHALSY